MSFIFAIQDAIEHGEKYDLELRFITAKGNELWVQTVCTPEILDGKKSRLKNSIDS
jgi:hypothetical protein